MQEVRVKNEFTKLVNIQVIREISVIGHDYRIRSMFWVWEDPPFLHSSCDSMKVALLSTVPTMWLLVGGDYNVGRVEHSLPSFCLHLIGILVAKSQELVIRQPTIKVINNDGLRSIVTVPPIASLFPVGLGKHLRSCV